MYTGGGFAQKEGTATEKLDVGVRDGKGELDEDVKELKLGGGTRVSKFGA